MAKRLLPLSKVYGLLEPGPVVLVTTLPPVAVHRRQDRRRYRKPSGECCTQQARPNIMTLSWHLMMEFEPPLVGCVISNRNYTFGVLKATKECVINIPTVELAEKVVGCGNTSGASIDKFAKFRLTPAAAGRVAAPLIDECYANLECKVVDTRMTAKYCFFILEVIKAWVDPSVKHPRTMHHLGGGTFMVAGKTIQLPSKMR